MHFQFEITKITNAYDDEQYQLVAWDNYGIDYPIGQAWNNREDCVKQVRNLMNALNEFVNDNYQANEED